MATGHRRQSSKAHAPRGKISQRRRFLLAPQREPRGELLARREVHGLGAEPLDPKQHVDLRGCALWRRKILLENR
jgi:hypothetical protein